VRPPKISDHILTKIHAENMDKFPAAAKFCNWFHDFNRLAWWAL